MDLRFERFEIESFRSSSSGGFTLIELLVVISVIAILMGLLFPAFRGVQDQAKKTQAKNDLTQIVTAVNAFYTDYGVYPVDAGSDQTFGGTGKGASNKLLINPLRATDLTRNPRQIVFLNPPNVKDDANPRSGITTDGEYYDPWGQLYLIAVDGDYSNTLNNPYSQNAGPATLTAGVIAWSLGKDGKGGSGDKNSGDADDDVISWQ